MLMIDEIYFFKKTKTSGSFSIKFSTNSSMDLYINDIILNTLDSTEPISYYKNNGTPLISGSFFDLLKRQLFKIFKEIIVSEDIGFYKFKDNVVTKQ